MAAQAAEAGRTMTSLRLGDVMLAELTEPVRHAGEISAAVGGYDDVVQRIYAASLALHAALDVLDGHRVAERIDQAINDLDKAVSEIHLATAWPHAQRRDHPGPSDFRPPQPRDPAYRSG
ncbi:MAG TPA: hypothetical protein VFZ85_13390 [Jiangellaceae bacterium]